MIVTFVTIDGSSYSVRTGCDGTIVPSFVAQEGNIRWGELSKSSLQKGVSFVKGVQD
jgi:hypothetical protein